MYLFAHCRQQLVYPTKTTAVFLMMYVWYNEGAKFSLPVERL